MNSIPLAIAVCIVALVTCAAGIGASFLLGSPLTLFVLGVGFGLCLSVLLPERKPPA